ncbi:MAG TPA: PIN domain-containing protein [Thermodesulfobacteriota bacterium]|nr:PIN domain-containing protein [Thermodesulfobacteriota bacterium]
MAAVLIDTNVLVYLYDSNDSTRQMQARRVLERLELTRRGRLSVQALSEFFSVATRKLVPALTPGEAFEQITLFARVWPVFDLTSMVVLEAGRGARDYRMSFYDAQVWATARLNQVPLVLSEDFRSGSILEGVRFLNPFSPEFHVDDWLSLSS